LARVKENIAKHGFHISTRGKLITSLGRPLSVEKKWRARAIELYMINRHTGMVAHQIAAEGGPTIPRTTIRNWINAAAAANAASTEAQP
jgi:hypothetical protein